MKTSVLLDHEPVPGGRVVRVLLRVEAEPPPQTDRLPLNLSIVLDRSGSMHGEKLHAAREAAALLVRRLSPEDVVSVVAYDDVVQTVAEPAKGATQAGLARAIEQIETGGSTNLSGGWLRGRELVAQNVLQRGVNRVILLTDGLANMGIQHPQQLTGLSAEGRKAGVTTTTIGFGEDYDETLLRAMADAGGGNMYYIERPDQAPSIFADELQGLLELGAQNVAIRVTPAAATELVAVHHDYPRTHAEGTLRIEFGDLYAREPKPLLAEFLVTADAAAEVAVAELVITAAVVTAEGSVEHQTVRLPITFSASEGARVEPELRRELLLLEVAKARREALERRARGDYDGAVEALHEAHMRLSAAGLEDPELREEAADLSVMEESMVAGSFAVAEEKYMYQRAYNASTGRRKKDDLIRRTQQKRKSEPPRP